MTSLHLADSFGLSSFTRNRLNQPTAQSERSPSHHSAASIPVNNGSVSTGLGNSASGGGGGGNNNVMYAGASDNNSKKGIPKISVQWNIQLFVSKFSLFSFSFTLRKLKTHAQLSRFAPPYPYLTSLSTMKIGVFPSLSIDKKKKEYRDPVKYL